MEGAARGSRQTGEPATGRWESVIRHGRVGGVRCIGSFIYSLGGPRSKAKIFLFLFFCPFGILVGVLLLLCRSPTLPALLFFASTSS